MIPPKHIVVLFHESAKRMELNYLVNRYAEVWREDGHTVTFLFGIEEFVPADLILVHVDLSVTPVDYIEFARRYPIALNADITDIRKSRYSQLLLQRGDRYDGKVIVKSDLNDAGIPERIAWATELDEFAPEPIFESSADYRVFNSLRDVPRSVFDNPDLVVEKFVPETEGDIFFVRSMVFLGDRFVCNRIASKHPVVKHATRIGIESVEPHPEMIALARAMKFDFGKFDYVIHNGRPVLLDANKTTGAANLPSTAAHLAQRRYRAEGLYYFFRTPPFR